MNIEDIKIKYFVYPRKSSEAEDRQVLSIESQIGELENIARKEKLDILEVLPESHSAKAPGRPIFNTVIERIKKGEANGIFIWSPNRLSRNSVDTGQIIYLLDIGKLAEVRTPSQIFRNTPNDKFLLSLFCSQAKLENDNKGVDVKRGMTKKASMGWHPGVAKPGYINEKYSDKGTKRILKHRTNFNLIKKCFEAMLSKQYRPSEILRMLNDDWSYRSVKRRKLGGKPMSKSVFYNMLSEPFYYGWYEYPLGSGDWYEGKHEAMISEEDFNKIQLMLGKRNPRPTKKGMRIIFMEYLNVVNVICQLYLTKRYRPFVRNVKRNSLRSTIIDVQNVIQQLLK